MESGEVRKLIAEYCSNRREIIACYILGSFAAGSNRPGSDLDLAFLLAPEVPASEFGSFWDSVVVDLGRQTRLVIHPVIMNNAGEFILGQIFRKGICVYQSNDGDVREFRRNKLPLIAEFDYYISMMSLAQKRRYGAADGRPHDCDSQDRAD
jgi:predicted nucleotidyltransferase